MNLSLYIHIHAHRSCLWKCRWGWRTTRCPSGRIPLNQVLTAIVITHIVTITMSITITTTIMSVITMTIAIPTISHESYYCKPF